jgi:hypothetical protein
MEEEVGGHELEVEREAACSKVDLAVDLVVVLGAVDESVQGYHTVKLAVVLDGCGGAEDGRVKVAAGLVAAAGFVQFCCKGQDQNRLRIP